MKSVVGEKHIHKKSKVIVTIVEVRPNGELIIEGPYRRYLTSIKQLVKKYDRYKDSENG